jgi:hypothetical protein
MGLISGKNNPIEACWIFGQHLKPGLFTREQMGMGILYKFGTKGVTRWMMQLKKHFARPEDITVHGQYYGRQSRARLLRTISQCK